MLKFLVLSNQPCKASEWFLFVQKIATTSLVSGLQFCQKNKRIESQTLPHPHSNVPNVPSSLDFDFFLPFLRSKQPSGLLQPSDTNEKRTLVPASIDQPTEKHAERAESGKTNREKRKRTPRSSQIAQDGATRTPQHVRSVYVCVCVCALNGVSIPHPPYPGQQQLVATSTLMVSLEAFPTSFVRSPIGWPINRMASFGHSPFLILPFPFYPFLKQHLKSAVKEPAWTRAPPPPPPITLFTRHMTHHMADRTVGIWDRKAAYRGPAPPLPACPHFLTPGLRDVPRPTFFFVPSFHPCSFPCRWREYIISLSPDTKGVAREASPRSC